MPYNKTLTNPWQSSLKEYLLLTKPGIVLGNLVSLSGGFFMASRGHITLFLFLMTALGTACVIASACILNNLIDRDIDRLMARTQKRITAQGKANVTTTVLLAATLCLLGLALLYHQTTMSATIAAAIGFSIYILSYSLFSKRNTVHGTLIGSFAGAMPPVIGYCAAIPNPDTGALILFTMFSLWQMPHSFAITIFRETDYRLTTLPLLPLVRGNTCAKKQMLAYILAFIVVGSLLTVWHYTGYIYLGILLLLGSCWFYLTLKGFRAENNKEWAKQNFLFSIVVMMTLSIIMAIDYQPFTH